MREKIASICYPGKHKIARAHVYHVSMAGNNSVRATLAQNLRMLMQMRNPVWRQVELAHEAGVSQRTVSNMLAGDDDQKSGATLDRVDAVASVFGLRGWHLIMPGLPDDIEHAKIMSDVITAYILADDGGKDIIHRVAEREGQHKKHLTQLD